MDEHEEHPDHDGIVEHDNHLPGWWLVTLFGAIAFAFVYWGYYHTLAIGQLQASELAVDQKALDAQRATAAASSAGVGDEVLLAHSRSDRVKEGALVFQQNCVACHGQRGEGGVGPNLTDAFWVHGSRPTQIYTTIANGVIEKGMLAWMAPLGESKVRDVTAFLLTLKNTNVAGKAPQGEPEK